MKRLRGRGRMSVEDVGGCEGRGEFFLEGFVIFVHTGFK